VPVVWGEEIELDVLGALVSDVLAVEHHPEPEIPLGDVQVMEEAGDGHGQPPLSLGGELLEGQPMPVVDRAASEDSGGWAGGDRA
jgi:hypothetical protein